MQRQKVFQVDGDCVTVYYYYNEEVDRYLGDYPDFATAPRYTPNGHPWVNVTQDGCPYAPKGDNDCSCCSYLKKEQPWDLIGVCVHEEYRNKAQRDNE